VNLVVNGKEHEIQEDATVVELVTSLGLTEGPVAVEVNREIVPRALHASRRLAAGDVVEIVHFVGGG
jgi:sulfur carrier protein